MKRNYENAKDVLAAMRERSSCRVFEDRPIPDELLKELLETGINAASGGNLQPYSVIVIKDQERKEQLCKMSWGQPFIASAAVDLVFLLDWNKYKTYAAMKDAPFVANHVFSEFVVGIEDMAICAQTIETAAHLCGIGSCYVASVIDAGDEARKLLHNPEYTYPILAMSLGYPKKEQSVRRKHMSYEGMVFEEQYPDFTKEQIYDLFEDKFEGLRYKLPSKEEYRVKKIAQLKAALDTCYSEEDSVRILKDVEENGFMNEAQRCFGLFYNADNMQKLSKILLEDMKKMGIEMK